MFRAIHISHITKYNVNRVPEGTSLQKQITKMKTKKYIGVWMDHSAAHLMELSENTIITKTIESEFTKEEKSETLGKSGEFHMHNKEQQQQLNYYNAILDSLKEYQEIFLFGPTTAKNELLNLLRSDHHFDNAKIEVKHADKMPENQQQIFVRDHFHSLHNFQIK